MKQWIAAAAALVLAACQTTQKLPETEVKPVAAHKTATQGIADFDTAAPQQPIGRSMQEWINREAAKGHYTKEQLENLLASAEVKQSILNAMDKPGTSQPWYVFRQGNADAARISGGAVFMQKNAAALQVISQRYGVPPELITAIIGIETRYGAYAGSYRVLDALNTLAFYYPRRAAYFRGELSEFLELAYEEKRDPASFTGSFAGAMGMPQFMPSSWRKWAVDWDGDGHRDIWNNADDAAASVANYMKQYGWRSGEPIAVPVAMSPTPQLQRIIDEPTALKYTAGQLRALGVVIPERIADSEKGVLYRLETAPGVYEYWFGLHNFYVVWQYNHSRMYVAAVREIANGIGAGL